MTAMPRLSAAFCERDEDRRGLQRHASHDWRSSLNCTPFLGPQGLNLSCGIGPAGIIHFDLRETHD
jgi:hypothetical protein